MSKFQTSEGGKCVSYDFVIYILRLSDNPDVNEVIKFLRQREIVHFQRFGEALDNLQSKLKHKKVYTHGMKKDCGCDK